jgi:hypothetical protein
MALVSANPNAETTNGIAAKVAFPSLALGALGVVLCILDLTGVLDVEDEIWITLLGAAGGVLGIGIPSPASLQRSKTTDGTPARI